MAVTPSGVTHDKGILAGGTMLCEQVPAQGNILSIARRTSRGAESGGVCLKKGGKPGGGHRLAAILTQWQTLPNVVVVADLSDHG